MKKCRFLLLLTMLLVSIGSFAQTTVEFVAGTEKGTGKNPEYDWKGSAGDDEVVIDGVKMHSNNATFAANKYSVKNIGLIKKTLAFTAAQNNIESIVFVEGDNLGKLSADGFDASASKWTGKAMEVSFTVSGEVKFSKVIVTMESKPATTLAFEQLSVINYIELGKTSTAPAVTLKSGDNVLTGLALTYESSNTDVATVDGAGVLTPKAVGTTTITAKFAGNDEYEGSEAQFTFNVVDGKNIFHETFDNMSGQGGNDGNFGLTASMIGNLSGNLSKCDNESWTTPSVNSNGKADKCVRIEMSSSITTPALSNLSGDAFLMFRAAQNRDAGTSISLSISGGGQLEQTSVSLEKAFNDYTILVRNATPQTKITFSCSAFGCFYLDDVKIERAIVLDENADNNSQVLEDNQLEPVNVAFKRALSSDYWNTICLPFDVAAGDVAEIFGEGTVVKAFKGWDAASSTLTFENAEAMEAGIPYLIKPGLTVSAFMFEDETVQNTEGTVSSNGVTFQGTLNATVLEASDVFIGTDGVLYRPDTETAGSDRMLGFRAYFKGIDPAVNAKVNFDGTATSISQIATGAQAAGKVYTIDGRYAGTSTEGLAKGLYIAGGKKVVVK